MMPGALCVYVIMDFLKLRTFFMICTGEFRQKQNIQKNIFAEDNEFERKFH